jgi:hypothetical protein
VVVGALYGVWYPPPLFQASGLEQFLTILLGVDVIVGPLLTLIVFRSGKPGLKKDLGLIAIAQAAALVYGLHVMWQARPVFLVAAVDRFQVLSANDVVPGHLAAAKGTEYGTLPKFGAKQVGAKGPTDLIERQMLREEISSGGKDFDSRPQYFVPYADVAADLAKRGRPLRDLLDRYPEHQARIEAMVTPSGHAEEGMVYVPVKAPRRFVTAILDPEGELVGMVDADPWFVAEDGSPAPDPAQKQQ